MDLDTMKHDAEQYSLDMPLGAKSDPPGGWHPLFYKARNRSEFDSIVAWLSGLGIASKYDPFALEIYVARSHTGPRKQQD